MVAILSMEDRFSRGRETTIEHLTKTSVQALPLCLVLFPTWSFDHAHRKMRIAGIVGLRTGKILDL